MPNLIATHPQDDPLSDLSVPALPPRLRPSKRARAENLDAAWTTLLAYSPADVQARDTLANLVLRDELSRYQQNIEACVGSVRVPLGVIGPLRVRGTQAQGDFYVPLATTEASLVASYARGAQLISASGGCEVAILDEGVGRAPCFEFASLHDALAASQWALAHQPELAAAAEATTRHGRLRRLRPQLAGRLLYLLCEYRTGDASGQNMVTLATEALCRHLLAHCPMRPGRWYLESNLSGDKKATALALSGVRGRRVSADARLPGALVERLLHTDVATIVHYHHVQMTGAALSGMHGAQGHYANGLAALYLATGQDVACVAESAVGITRMEADGDALQVSVTLPNVMVGTVGGGTHLPTQNAALRVMGLAGNGKAGAFAEVCAAVCLAGELSLFGAICAGEFAAAHRSLARERA